MSKLVVSNINKSYCKKQILKNINFIVEEGKLLALLGPSGCGKSTTLKVIAGLVEDYTGDVLLDDESIIKKPIEQRGTVIVFQNHLLFPHLTVEQNIGFGLKMAGKSKKEIKNKVDELLELVQLPEFHKKSPTELSGGQQQRVALARALAAEPKILLLDEPFSSLDTKLREEMRNLTLAIQKQKKITTILVTHDKEEAMMCSDEIAVMLDGEIQQIGKPTEIYYYPVNMKVANFMGEKNYISGKVENGWFKSIIGNYEISLEDDREIVLMIRPEDIQLGSDTNQMKAKIESVQFAGERIFYTISILGQLLKTVQPSTTIYNVGDLIPIKINISSPIFFEVGVEKND